MFATPGSDLLCFLFVFPEVFHKLFEGCGFVFLKADFIHKNKIISHIILQAVYVFTPLPQTSHLQRHIKRGVDVDELQHALGLDFLAQRAVFE